MIATTDLQGRQLPVPRDTKGLVAGIDRDIARVLRKLHDKGLAHRVKAPEAPPTDDFALHVYHNIQSQLLRVLTELAYRNGVDHV